ncbi:hypothetical protein [Streptomyces odonnellii]|uniref:hypothetical protein n=1 Tax=Streptomyces odonnellii TaxID=1417980 RepID=UPI000626BF83|nr:hypothetical protein [Streptomyces odonnellii]
MFAYLAGDGVDRDALFRLGRRFGDGCVADEELAALGLGPVAYGVRREQALPQGLLDGLLLEEVLHQVDVGGQDALLRVQVLAAVGR